MPPRRRRQRRRLRASKGRSHARGDRAETVEPTKTSDVARAMDTTAAAAAAADEGSRAGVDNDGTETAAVGVRGARERRESDASRCAVAVSVDSTEASIYV